MDALRFEPPRPAAPAERRVLVFGASIRAAAESLRRAGFVPWGADLFADVDQIACSPTIRVARYPQDLADACQRLPASPWLHTGGLENDPDVLQELTHAGPLLGMDVATIRQVRDPELLDRVLAPAGFPLPEFSLRWPTQENPSHWLWKPFRSAGGLGLRWAKDARKSAGYFQRFVKGEVLGATFLGSSAGVRLVGVTQQLAGPDWGQAPGFVYGGSIGPLPLEPRRIHQLETLGTVLRGNFELIGLFGVDLIDDGHQFWPLEVNPRYTASVEVLELATGRPLMADHVRACRPAGNFPSDRSLDSRPARWSATEWPMVGKAIVYARRPFTVTAPRARRFGELHQHRPMRWAADLPFSGATIPSGAPILTVFASGQTLESIRTTLRERIAECRK